jgi:D-alanine-D-alanine ligase
MKKRGYANMTIRVPAGLPDATRDALMHKSRGIFGVLGVRDFGRLDFRLGTDGQLYFLEVNALPSLEAGASLYLSGALAGMSSTAAVLGAMIASAAARNGLSVEPGATVRR